jgi:outer membrane immunogenic protein
MIKKFTKALAAAMLLGVVCLTSTNVLAQGFAPENGFKQVNLGVELEGFGLPVYVGMDFGVGSNITVGPRIMFERESEIINQRRNGKDYDLRQTWTYIVPSFRGDYHFSGLINGMTDKLDLYGGLTLGYAILRSYSESLEWDDNYDYVVREHSASASDAKLWAQVGARYYFSENWAAQLEFSTWGEDAAIGISYRF